MRWVTAIGAGLLAGLLFSVAVAGEREPVPVDRECEAGWLVMTPDAEGYQFLVILTRTPDQPRRWVYASRGRCEDARAPLAELLERTGLGTVTPCS